MNEWPALPYHEWRDTLETVRRWTQVVGKIRLALTPFNDKSRHGRVPGSCHIH